MVVDKNDKAVAVAIGKALAKHRKVAGLTQSQVAERLDISIDAVSRMERGGILPSVTRLMQFSEIFNCTTADLITQTSPNKNDQIQRIDELLSSVDKDEREQLMMIVESLVKWRVRS